MVWDKSSILQREAKVKKVRINLRIDKKKEDAAGGNDDIHL